MAKRQPRLTTQKILDWAEARFKRTGRWPTHRSGGVHGAPGEDWNAIHRCLVYGGRGLPGGSSLAYLLARRRGLISGRQRPLLSIELILVWADRHYIRTGMYPTFRSGSVTGIRGESWRKIDVALREGFRGLPGGSSLVQLLSRRRGRALRRQHPFLSINEILTWADAHHRRIGSWPNRDSGRIQQAPTETWGAVDSALKVGSRRLPGRSSLVRLLVERRGAESSRYKKRLTIDDVLRWADGHKRRTGAWPTATLGAVGGVTGETWKAIDAALRRGQRGLPGGSSLSQLLGARRGKPLKRPLPKVHVSRILAWADQHRRRAGDWPTTRSGPIKNAAHESWQRVNQSLGCGYISGTEITSLLKLLAKRRGKMLPKPPTALTIPRILKWADEHHARTGWWPTQHAGPLHAHPEELWKRIDGALRKGSRGLPGGSSLCRVLARHRPKALRSRGSRLTITHVLACADRHHARMGRWPTGNSSDVTDAAGDTWKTLDEALRIGRRGLPGGSSLAKVLALRGRKPNQGNLPRLTNEVILTWARQHRRRTGDWPHQRSGPVREAPEETWKNISAALRSGVRGLPGGSSLPRLLNSRRARLLPGEKDRR